MGRRPSEEDHAWQGDQQSSIDFSPQAKWKFCTVGGPKFSKSFSKALSEPFLKRRHYMQIFYCITIFCELPADDPLLLVARSNHWPAPCLARCFWHNLYDCLLSITFSYCHLLLSQKPFWLNHNLLVSSGALLLIGACSSNNAQGTYICYVPFIDHICVLVVKLCIDSIL